MGGDLALLEAVRSRLLAAGAHVSDAPSKLRRALGDRVPAAAARRSWRDSAGEALLTYLRDRVEDLVRHDPLVRVDAPDAVHQMRVELREAAHGTGRVPPGRGAEGDRDEIELAARRAAVARRGARRRPRQRGRARPAPRVRRRRSRPSSCSARSPRFSPRPSPRATGPHTTPPSRRWAAPATSPCLDALDAFLSPPPRGPRAGDPADEVLRKQLRRTYRAGQAARRRGAGGGGRAPQGAVPRGPQVRQARAVRG